MQSPDNETNTNAAPCLTGNGLWSPSSPTSSVTVLTPACSSAEGPASVVSSIEPMASQLVPAATDSRLADANQNTSASMTQGDRDGDTLPVGVLPQSVGDTAAAEEESRSAHEDSTDGFILSCTHDVQTPPPLVRVPNMCLQSDVDVMHALPSSQRALSKNVSSHILTEKATAVVSGAVCQNVTAELDETRAPSASATLETEEPVNESTHEYKDEDRTPQLTTEAHPEDKCSGVEAGLGRSQQPRVSASPSPSQQEWIETPSVSLHDTDVSVCEAEARKDGQLDDASSKQERDHAGDEDADDKAAEANNREQQRQRQDVAQPPAASTSASSPSPAREPSIPKPSFPRKRGAAAPTTTAAAPSVDATGGLAWVSCNHSDPPARYRDTPAYYCSYCSYTVCEACYVLIPAPLPPTDQNQQRKVEVAATAAAARRHRRYKTEAIPRSAAENKHKEDEEDDHASEERAEEETSDAEADNNVHPVSVNMNWLDDVLSSPSTAVRSGGAALNGHKSGATTAAAKDVSSARHARSSHTHRRLFTSTPDSNSDHHGTNKDPPSPCHLCRRGHLLREEALLYEWCCEGPAPENRQHRGHTLVYDTQNLQKYHFRRAQRDTRRFSTAPLHAQVLSVSPAILQPETQDHHQRKHDASSPALHQAPVGTSPSRKYPAPLPLTAAAASSTAGLHGRLPHRSTRHAAAAAALASPLSAAAAGGGASGHSHTRRHRSAVTALRNACEEGGSFVFSVRNPRLEVPLVWCAVNCQPREETPAYACAAGVANTHTRGNSGIPIAQLPSASSSITPLLMWRCPPSLPGLPARPYRVVVPYGIYAFANVHALTLYAASDIFRKATAHLVGSASHGGVVDGMSHRADERGDIMFLAGLDGSAQHLASVKVAPAALLRPLLTVTVLHRVATTPRPLPFTSRSLLSADAAATVAPSSQKNAKATAQGSVAGRASKRTRTPDTSGTSQEENKGNERGAKRSKSETLPAAAPPLNEETIVDETSAAAGRLKWPDGLASPELSLCVDHLLHGRSVAVYGIASKYFFLQHIASSAELQHFHVCAVDASLGRASVQHHSGVSSVNNNSNTGAVGLDGGVRRGCQFGGGAVNSSSTSAASPVTRQLLSVGHALIQRVSSPMVLTAEMRAQMSAAAAAGQHAPHTDEGNAGSRNMEKKTATHHTKFSFADDADELEGVGEDADPRGEAASQSGVARAFLPGDVGRSPAMARDGTRVVVNAASVSAAHPQQQRSPTTAVDVVDVDSFTSSTTRASSISSLSGDKTAHHLRTGGGDAAAAAAAAGGVTPARGTVREILSCVSQTPPSSTHRGSSPFDKRSPHTHLLLGSTPLSQRISKDKGGRGSGGCTMTQLGPSSQASASSLPVLSPIPAFFEALQHTVNGKDRQSNEDDDDRLPPNDRHDGQDEESESNACCHRVTCEELPEFFGGLNSLRLPPLVRHRARSSGKLAPSAAATTEMTWRPPVVVYANDAVRRHVLQGLRRQHHGRRCVQWASLPSTSAAAQLDEQTRQPEDETSASSSLLPRTLLTSAHQTRPGWQPPVLLVLHSVDLLDGDEVNIFLQLCAQFALPQPHLQLLISFDDPLWPLGPVAAALERLGVCAVQLRSLLLPRVHEMQHVSSIHLLTEFEAAAGSGARRNKKAAFGRSVAAGAATAAAASAGNSHLLQDTMRRVLFSLPPAFNSLLRILLDVQDEVGEGVFISLFTVTERFEKNGVMVSQGRLKALLKELTSNRIARYDSAEHALMVLQVSRLRKVLDEVTAQREGGGMG